MTWKLNLKKEDGNPMGRGPVLYCSEGEITGGGGVVWVKAKKS
jgi:hypothetical protein